MEFFPEYDYETSFLGNVSTAKSQALTGKSKTAYGFTWEYASIHDNADLLEGGNEQTKI